MIISDLFSSKDACPVCGQTPCNCTHIAESVAEANYSDTPLSTYSNNANPELRNIHIPGNMKHPGWKEPTWSFAEVAEKLGLTPKELQQLAFSLGNFPKKAEGVKSSYGSKAYYPRSEIKRWVNASGIRDIIKSRQGVAEQQVNEISPYDFDSDADYYDALRAQKRRAQGRSADDYDEYEDEPMDNNDDDESYYEKYVRTKGLEEVEDQKPESLTYKDLFKQPEPGQETEPKDELHLHNWDEYWKLRNEKQPQQQKDVAEGDKKPEPPEADYGDDYQDMVGRLKKLAGMGPLKTVYDPKRRVYRNMPTAVQPPKK